MTRQTQTQDVLIIGAGIIGLLCSLRLRQAGYQVRVCDALTQHQNAQATRASAGMINAQVDYSSHNPLIWRDIESRTHYLQLIEELKYETGLTVEHQTCGLIKLEDQDTHTKTYQWQQEAQLGVQMIDTQTWTPFANQHLKHVQIAEHLRCGVYFKDEARIHTIQLSQALKTMCIQRGVRFLDNDLITHIQCNQEQTQATQAATQQGLQLYFDKLLLCAGAWSSQIKWINNHNTKVDIAGLDHKDIYPVHGVLCELHVPHSSITHTLLYKSTYIVPRYPDSVIVGATITPYCERHFAYAQEITQVLEQAMQLCPSLKQASLIKSWSGLRPQSLKKEPLIGIHSDVHNLYLATGHYRHGILLAPYTAQYIVNHMTQA